MNGRLFKILIFDSPMDHDLDKIKEFAISSSLVDNPEVSLLDEGYGNYVFLIKENNKKFVLRIKKSKEVQFDDSLEREHSFLRYFESKGINFCPKTLYYNRPNNFLIQKFIKGEKIHQKEFSNEQIDLFAKQLYEMFSLSVDEFFDFCEREGLKKCKYNNPITSLKKYGFNRFKEAEKGDVPKDVIEWMKIGLDENLKYLTGLGAEAGRLGFSWGDVQSTVLIDDLGNMSFYDFEHAAISHAADLTYIKIHGKFDDSQFEYLVDRYCYYFGKDRGEVDEEILANEKIIRVNDVVWAAMKWAVEGGEKFKDLTYKRMVLAENLSQRDDSGEPGFR